MSETAGARNFPAGGYENRPASRPRSRDNSAYSDESYDPKSEEGTPGAFTPIKPSAVPEDQRDHGPMQKQRSNTSRSIERIWSLNDGYSCNPGYDEGEKTDENDGDNAQGTDYVVGWDEGDPANPRNFPTLRRWFIVLTCSMGSLCAYASGSPASGLVSMLIILGLVPRRSIRSRMSRSPRNLIVPSWLQRWVCRSSYLVSVGRSIGCVETIFR